MPFFQNIRKRGFFVFLWIGLIGCSVCSVGGLTKFIISIQLEETSNGVVEEVLFVLFGDGQNLNSVDFIFGVRGLCWIRVWPVDAKGDSV